MLSHVIPRFYLQQFADDSDALRSTGSIWVYAKNRRPRLATPVHECREDKYFAITGTDGGIDESFETVVTDLENRVHDLLPYLSYDSLFLSLYLKRRLIAYVSLLHARTWARRHYHLAAWDQIVSQMHEAAQDQELLELASKEFSIKGIREISPTLVREIFIRIACENAPHHARNAFVLTTLSHVKKIAESLCDRPCQLWIAPPGSEFVTSDNPVLTKMPKLGPNALGWGFLKVGVVVVCPLRHNVCIAVGAQPEGRVTVSSTTVEEINRNVVMCMTRFAYSRTRRESLAELVDSVGATVRMGQNAFVGEPVSIRDLLIAKTPVE